MVYNNGTDVVTAVDHIPSLTLGAALNVDVISEKTAAAGVTIDGVLLKDTVVTANTVKASGTASSQGKVEFFEDTDNGTNFVALQAPATVATNVTFTLPAADGTNGQVIQTNGSGALSFATVAASPGGSTTQVQFNNAGAFGGISGVTTDGTRMTASTTIGVGGATPSASGSWYYPSPLRQSASTDANTLDDYEEGTWTATLTPGTVR
jgi:trimeric autotransporter adhesin